MPQRLEITDPLALRALGCLIEKEALTPEAYPLSLNSLTLACNQKTGREPVMEVGEGAVYAAVRELEAIALAKRIEGARATKWRHLARECWALEESELALMALLLVRGPQTAGELRTRAERLHPFASPEAVEGALARLASAERGLARNLSRMPGQKEARWAHALGHAGDGHRAGDQDRDLGIRAPAAIDEVAGLMARIEALEARVAELEERTGREARA